MAPNVFEHSSSHVVVDSAPNSGEGVESVELILNQHIIPTPQRIDTSVVGQDPIFSPLSDNDFDQFLLGSGFENDWFWNQKDSHDFVSQQLSSGTPKQRLRQVLDKYKNVNSTKSHLAQLWFPISMEDDLILRNSGRYAFGPFVNDDPIKNVYKRYVLDCVRKAFPIGLKNAGYLGVADAQDVPLLSNFEMGSILVNRWVAYKAFLLQRAQWAPNIHIYSCNSQLYGICETLALPVFDCATNQCIAVLDLVINCSFIDYVAEIQEICQLLQEVCLRADTKIVNQPRQMALLEIMKLLRNVSQIHNLPLAQTWLPCKCCDENSETIQICMCNAEIPFILMDSSLYKFWKAGSMYHMCEGQGVAGRALLSMGSCFCTDITQFSDQNFPLVHKSRKFSVYSCLAICLKSTNTGDDIYIVQFFIRNRLTTVKEKKHFVDSIFKSVIQNFESLKPASSELEEIDAKSGTITKLDWVSSICMVDEQNNIVSSSKTFQDKLDKGKGLMVKLNSTTRKLRKKKTQDVVSCEEDLLPYLSGTKEDAAHALRVSISTVKRIPRQFGYKNWSDAQKSNGVSPTKRRSKARHKCEALGFGDPSSSSAT